MQLFSDIITTTTKNGSEKVLLKVFFKLSGISLMHKIWKQIFINNVLLGVLRIEGTNLAI